MANNKSAEKRIRTNERNRLENRFYKSSVRTLTKKFLKDLEKLTQMLGAVYSLIDKGTKRNVYHRNTAARKKAQLAAYLKSA